MQKIPAVGETLLDRYRVEEVLEADAETAVLRCLDLRLDIEDAVKVLLGDESEPEWEARKGAFVQSFRSMARLNHPNVVQVANIESRRGSVFSVMEMLRGQTLSSFLSCGGFLEPKEAVELFLGILDAVAMAHANGVIHRRISPREVILNVQGSRFLPKVINFSSLKVAKDLDAIGVLPYLAPEQYDDFGSATTSSDVYGLCATMYAVLSHEPPVIYPEFESYRQFFAIHDGVSVFSETIPESFIPILQKGLRRDPECRYKDATALLQDVKSLGSNFSLSANLSLDATKDRQMTGSTSGIRAVTGSVSAMRMATGSHPIMHQVSSPDLRPISPSRPIVSAVEASSPDIRSMTHSRPLSEHSSRPLSQSLSEHSSRPLSQSLSEHSSRPLSQPVSQPSLEASSRACCVQAHAAGAEEVLVEAGSASLWDGIVLPAPLSDIYTLRRVDSRKPKGFIGAVSTKDAPDMLYGIKCFYPENDLEKAIFNEGVRRSERLSRESASIEQIVQSYPDVSSFLIMDEARLTLPDSVAQMGRYTAQVVVQIGILLGEAMDMAHRYGYVNGNIKPSNIIFENRDGVMMPVWYDFGQSLYLSSKRQISPEVLGYIAPELGYDLQRSNAQADIFAFGMCLVFMLLGRLPYESTGYALADEREKLGAVPDLRLFNADLPQDLLNVIGWCTQFDPSKRYVQFSDVVRDLRLVYAQLSQ